MSSDQTTTSHEKLPTAPEHMERDAIHELQCIDLVKLIAATLNTLNDYENYVKYKDIALHPSDLSQAIYRVGYGVGRTKDINEVNDLLRIGEDIIWQLDRFKASIQCMIDDARRAKWYHCLADN